MVYLNVWTYQIRSKAKYVLWLVFFFFAAFVAALLRASPRSSAAVSFMSAAAPSSRMLRISFPRLLLYKISFPLLWISYFTSATTNAVAAGGAFAILLTLQPDGVSVGTERGHTKRECSEVEQLQGEFVLEFIVVVTIPLHVDSTTPKGKWCRHEWLYSVASSVQFELQLRLSWLPPHARPNNRLVLVQELQQTTLSLHMCK